MTARQAPSDPLTGMERAGLTIWGKTISAQIRDEAGGRILALHIMDGAPTCESPDLIAVPAEDIAKLYALLDEATNR